MLPGSGWELSVPLPKELCKQRQPPACCWQLAKHGHSQGRGWKGRGCWGRSLQLGNRGQHHSSALLSKSSTETQHALHHWSLVGVCESKEVLKSTVVHKGACVQHSCQPGRAM